MPAPNRILRLLSLCVLASAGCVKQDTEILARVGRKLADKSQTATASLREKLPFKLATASAPPTLADHIQQRLASDKQLSAVKIDVQVRGAEVELKGTVDKEEQKLRAFDLAETTQGVEKVLDSLQVRGEKAVEN